MLTAEDVYNQLLTLIPPESITGTDRVLSLCSRSLERIVANLKDRAFENDSRIAYAASCDAFYEYTLYLLADPENSPSFKIGDISIKKDPKDILEVAKLIKDGGYDSIRELMEDKDFGAWSI